jgi:aminoglycoside phosphotransferase (APT) family kinase protein
MTAAEDSLSPALLTSLLQRHLDPALECVALQRATAGNAQEVWFADAVTPDGTTRSLVVRRSAAAGTADETDRSNEYAVLKALAGQGFPVPAVHWLESDPSALGRPYFVMDRLPGRSPGRLGAGERREISRQIGHWLARLHAVDVASLPHELSRPPDRSAATRTELARWRERYLERRLAPIPMLGALLAWLEAHAPESAAQPCLVWGDAGPHNVLVDGDRVTALLDWEFAHLGDPLEDLGVAVWSCLDTYDPEDVVAAYEAEAGPVDRLALRHFEVFACVDRSIMLLGGIAAYTRGHARPSLAALGQHLLLDSLERAAVAAGWGRLEPPAPATSPAPSVLRLRPDVPETLAGLAAFLRGEVVAAVEDARLRRELKSAAALLDASARRASCEGPVLARREAELAELLRGGEDDLEKLAVRAELERSPARASLRRHLLADLAAQRGLLEPLARFYAPEPAPAQ